MFIVYLGLKMSNTQNYLKVLWDVKFTVCLFLLYRTGDIQGEETERRQFYDSFIYA